MLKVLISFLVGAAAGAAAALLLAPSSGEDLRHHLHDTAEADRERMRSEYQRGMDDLHKRMDKMSSNVSAKLNKNKDAAVDVEVEDVVEAAEVAEIADDSAPETA